MASSQSGSSKRRQSDGKKLSRARCRARARQRHEDNGRTQAKAHQHNLFSSSPSPWELARIERAKRRLVTCGKCRVPFNAKKVETPGVRFTEEGQCPVCGGTVNLKTEWQKRNGVKDKELSAA